MITEIKVRLKSGATKVYKAYKGADNMFRAFMEGDQEASYIGRHVAEIRRQIGQDGDTVLESKRLAH